jgi:uncharacterized protein (TIRG00374 family)
MKTEKKRSVRNSGRLFMTIVIGVSTIILISSLSGNREVFRILISSSPFWMFIAFISAITIIILDSLRIEVLAHSLAKNLGFWNSMKASVYGFYASAITPFSSGGQPFQIYYLTKLGLKVEEASMIVGVKFITSFTISIVWGFSALIRSGRMISSIPYVGKVMYLGVSLTVAFYVFMILLFSGGRVGKWFLSLPLVVVPMAFFLKKKREEIYEAVEEKVMEYRKTVSDLWKRSKIVFFINVLLSFFMMTLIFASPFFAMKAVGANVKFLETVEITAAMSMIFYFVPTPGASGGVEGVFYLVFANLTSYTLSASALIIWRFFTYHLSIILGTALSARYVFKEG